MEEGLVEEGRECRRRVGVNFKLPQLTSWLNLRNFSIASLRGL